MISLCSCRFQEACKIYGVPEQDVFQTSDLWERKDVAMVTTTLFALGRTVIIIYATKVFKTGSKLLKRKELAILKIFSYIFFMPDVATSTATAIVKVKKLVVRPVIPVIHLSVK